MELNKFQKFIEALNTYYAFALFLYAAALFFSTHSHLLFITALIVTPAITCWSGYLLKSYIDRRNLYYGFRVLRRSMAYEIDSRHRYSLLSTTKLKAASDHLMVYPILHQWTGSGQEIEPALLTPGQRLLGMVSAHGDKADDKHIVPYTLNTPSQGDWHVWFVGFNPPVQRNETVDVKYLQNFIDRKGTAKPYLYYVVSVPMKELELSVKFPKDALPVHVRATYYKPSEPRQPNKSASVSYDSDKQWATWTIKKPKRGYCYRIDWS